MWTKTGPYASAKLGGKIDKLMLTASISVEAQAEDGNSLLNVYRRFSMLRNSCPALAEGTMSPASVQGSSIAAWYMTSTEGQKVLVIHNLASSSKTVSVQDDMSKPLAVLGEVSRNGNDLILGANSSAVFQL